MPLSDDQPHTRTRLPVAEQSVYQPSARRSRPLRTLLTVLVVVTLLVLAISIANRGKQPGQSAAPPSADRAGQSGQATPGTPAPADTAASGQEPVATTSHGIANGFPHTDQGAQSAAANYATALGSAEMFQTAARHTLVATVSDPSVAADLQTRLDQAYGPATATAFGLDAQGKAPKGLTFVSRTVPVGTRTTNGADTATKVEVWCTRLAGLAGEHSTQPVTATWYTLSLTMRWTGSDWKVTDFSQQNGPAPLPGDQQAATADEITRAVQDFGGFRYAR
ncbi:hypothetical protein CFP65_4306 [Kitasatospora sp. MMS16-BH015]|uniref:hypothetical protein n=1 Tax=Kitasatospora sp. MMS16-BH015 TaxID=2018025 RepID=UPI000CA37279|nr:hypothetical protein [Kitasatospora sp. MMS16-BH015]AUG79057.1 hypothetical protein CFP65_4306 [Kitasatospora sp. MMS16-BH015]